MMEGELLHQLYFPLNFPEQYWRRSTVEERGDEKNVTTTTSHGESWFHPLDFTELQPPSLQDFTTPWARYPNLVWRGRDSSEGTRDFGPPSTDSPRERWRRVKWREGWAFNDRISRVVIISRADFGILRSLPEAIRRKRVERAFLL